MGLGKLFTCGLSCSSAPKSPPVPVSPTKAIDENCVPNAATAKPNTWADPTNATKLETNLETSTPGRPTTPVETKKQGNSQPKVLEKSPISPNKGGVISNSSPTKCGKPESRKKKTKAKAEAEAAEKEKRESSQNDGIDKLDDGEEVEVVKGPNMELVLKVFGFELSNQLQGKVWDERAQAVQAVRARLAQRDLNGVTMEDFFQGCCSVAQIALRDKVMPVYLDGLELAKLLLGEFFQRDEQVTEEQFQELAREGVHTLVPIIVSKSSDRNARSIEGTQSALVFLARQPLVGCQAVMTHMLMPIASAKEVAAIRGRLELITQFITEFGFSKTSAMSLSAVMGFVRPHLDATDEKVRRAAVEVTVQCYQLKGERTRKFCANLKPALLKLLEQRFAELDGTAKPKNLPALKGIKSRKGVPGAPNKGRPSAATSSRGSSRNTSSAGSIGSLGKHLGMPMPVDPTRKQLPISEDSIITSPFGSDPFACEDPSFIPSPTSAPVDMYGIDEESIMREIEAYS